MKFIVVDAEVIAANGGYVIGFARMRDGMVIRKCDALLRQRRKIRYSQLDSHTCYIPRHGVNLYVKHNTKKQNLERPR